MWFNLIVLKKYDIVLTGLVIATIVVSIILYVIQVGLSEQTLNCRYASNKLMNRAIYMYKCILYELYHIGRYIDM